MIYLFTLIKKFVGKNEQSFFKKSGYKKERIKTNSFAAGQLL
jgi:hypothetical protein